jgi:hypothetical protein
MRRLGFVHVLALLPSRGSIAGQHRVPDSFWHTTVNQRRVLQIPSSRARGQPKMSR